MKHKHFLQGLFFLGIGALVLVLSACPNPVNTDFALEEGDGDFEIAHYKGGGEPVESEFFPSSRYLARALQDFLGWSFTPTAKSEDGRLVIGNAVNEEGYSKGNIRIEPGTKVAVYWTVGRSRRGRDPWISRPKVIGVYDSDSLEGSRRARWRMRWRLRSIYGLLYLDQYSTYLETASSVTDLETKYSYDVSGAIGTAAYIANFQRLKVKSITPTLSDANEITSFMFAAAENPFDDDVVADIDGYSISAALPIGPDISLKPAIEIPETATISPPSGAYQDFTVPVTYTVTAESGLEAVYTVTVTFDPLDPPSSEAEILSFDANVAGSTVFVFDPDIYVNVPPGTGMILSPIVVVSEGASVSPGSGETVDFGGSAPVPYPYTVTAEDGISTDTYYVWVSDE